MKETLEPGGLLSQAPLLHYSTAFDTTGYGKKKKKSQAGTFLSLTSNLVVSAVSEVITSLPLRLIPHPSALRSAYFISVSALSPSPLNSIPSLALCLSPSAAGLLSH